jgi:hypothetical protein
MEYIVLTIAVVYVLIELMSLQKKVKKLRLDLTKLEIDFALEKCFRELMDSCGKFSEMEEKKVVLPKNFGKLKGKVGRPRKIK